MDGSFQGYSCRKQPPENIIAELACISIIYKLWRGRNRKNLRFYEKHYEKEIRGVFEDDEKLRKKLLRALRCKSNMYQATTILALVYTIHGNQPESRKYYQIAIANGQDAKALRKMMNDLTEN